MAPRKRISRVPTRIVVPMEELPEGSTRSIGIQTDPEQQPLSAPQPTKRQKILEKIKQLNKAKKQDGTSMDKTFSNMDTSSSLSCSSSTSSSSMAVLQSVALVPKSIEPGPNEKACQVKDSELAPIRPTRPKSDFAIRMERLKGEMDRRRIESIMWDINRLDALDEMINRDPPPRWAAACEMWLEVDQLEGRINAF
ncbi:hypothetical protein KR200_003096, partial [Drosophila serrata]